MSGLCHDTNSPEHRNTSKIRELIGSGQTDPGPSDGGDVPRLSCFSGDQNDQDKMSNDSFNPQTCWRVIKHLKDEGNETVARCNALKLRAADGRQVADDAGGRKDRLLCI